MRWDLGYSKMVTSSEVYEGWGMDIQMWLKEIACGYLLQVLSVVQECFLSPISVLYIMHFQKVTAINSLVSPPRSDYKLEKTGI